MNRLESLVPIIIVDNPILRVRNLYSPHVNEARGHRPGA
jgi:hypothetical protein